MKVTITMEVDIADLDIDARVYGESMTTEYWGSVLTDSWPKVDINAVYYQDQEVELSNSDLDAIAVYMVNNQEYDYDEY